MPINQIVHLSNKGAREIKDDGHVQAEDDTVFQFNKEDGQLKRWENIQGPLSDNAIF